MTPQLRWLSLAVVFLACGDAKRVYTATEGSPCSPQVLPSPDDELLTCGQESENVLACDGNQLLFCCPKAKLWVAIQSCITCEVSCKNPNLKQGGTLLCGGNSSPSLLDRHSLPPGCD
jgi:hypothetical protein